MFPSVVLANSLARPVSVVLWLTSSPLASRTHAGTLIMESTKKRRRYDFKLNKNSEAPKPIFLAALGIFLFMQHPQLVTLLRFSQIDQLKCSPVSSSIWCGWFLFMWSSSAATERLPLTSKSYSYSYCTAVTSSLRPRILFLKLILECLRSFFLVGDDSGPPPTRLR